MWQTDTYWFDVAIGLLVVHGWWLPRHGVNGWTAEPRERYYELMGLDPSGKPRDRGQVDQHTKGESK